MNFTEICIRRPVLSTVMSLIIVIVGLVAWDQLKVRQYPQVDQPVISVTTNFSGASPEVIENQVTRPLEDLFAGLEGIDTISSSSEAETSKISLKFYSSRSLDEAANDVRDKLGRVRQTGLPNEADEPTMSKSDADAYPIISLVLSSDNLPPKELNDYALRYLKKEFESLTGVANVQVSGAGEYTMRIYLDPIRMSAYNVTAMDVANALKARNIEKPAGRIVSFDREFLVTTKARLSTPQEFNNLVIRNRNNQLVRIRDVGKAVLDATTRQYKTIFNGKPSVGIGVVKQSTANPLTIAKAIYKLLPKIQEELPKDMKIDIAYDKTDFIQRSIDQVYKTIIEATILVIIVVFLFLGTVRASLIPLVTIPVSLIGAFGLIYMLDYTVNTLTLLALVLAIGLVVDDAIVMLENIHRHIENGMKPFKAAIIGSKEISFAVIAMTLTLAAVYAPIALSTGLTGRFFTEFALTLAGAVIISGFIALTLSPMMCSRLLTPHKKVVKSNTWRDWFLYVDEYYKKLEDIYEKALRWTLKHREWVIGGGLSIAILGYVIGLFLPSNLIPVEDQGLIHGMATAPQGATMEFTEKYIRQMDDIVSQVPEVDKQYTLITIPTAYSRIVLRPWENRTRSSMEIITELQGKLREITGIHSFVSNPRSMIGGGDDSSFEIVLQTTRSYEELKDLKSIFIHELYEYPGLINLQDTLSIEGQDYIAEVHNDRAAVLGVDTATIANTIDSLISGRRYTRFRRDNREYDVKIELEEALKRTPDDIGNIYVRGDKDKMIPLSTLVTLKGRSSPVQLSHFNQLRSVRITADVQRGYSLGEVIKFAKEVASKVLPEGTRVDFAGETRRFIQESGSIYLIFILALAFIFLIMAAQFESFIDPLIIMFSVPLAITGGLIMLALTSGSLNLFSQIGLVTLIGLITKHGILIVDFANKVKEEGKDPFEAAITASKLRLRPILMTTFAMVLGAIPLALATGPGGESRSQIGWVIVGGMSFGTLFTLFVVPTVYTYITRKRKEFLEA